MGENNVVCIVYIGCDNNIALSPVQQMQLLLHSRVYLLNFSSTPVNNLTLCL